MPSPSAVGNIAPSEKASMTASVVESSRVGSIPTKPAPRLFDAVDRSVWPTMRTITRVTSGSARAMSAMAPVPITVLSSVGASISSGCCTVTCPPPMRAARSIMSAQFRSCSAVMRIASRRPKEIDTSVNTVRRRLRQRLRHPIRNNSEAPMPAVLVVSGAGWPGSG